MMKCIDGKNHYWKDGWICEKCGIKKADVEDQKRIIRILTELLLRTNIKESTKKSSTYHGKWYEAIIPIGSDHVAYVMLPDDSLSALKKILETETL